MDAYIKSQIKTLYEPIYRVISKPKLLPTIVYTPLHGVGGATVDRLISSTELPKLLSVPSQSSPDPDFPTVQFPNPEEGLSVLKEAITWAEQNNSSLIFANDPDADRFNFAENTSTGWRLFTGNEIAAILADFLWSHRRTLAPTATEFVMVRSCVSSRLLCAMAQVEGFQVIETLTGFKYLANAAQDVQKRGKKVLLAYEEAIGFMCNTDVWDKDGMSSLLLMYLIMVDGVTKGWSLEQRLVSIYRKYGYFCQYNSYYRCEPASLITNVFTNARERLCHLQEAEEVKTTADMTGSCNIPLTKEVSMVKIKDYPGTNMITFYFDSDELSWMTLRASGTEPKIKFYSEMHCPYEDRLSTLQKLKTVVGILCDLLLEPMRNSMQMKE
jgi:phosphomannomutase